ncbi:AraC family transcriptional regulator [Halopolyspora algeriensis]|uniref:AraC family transcriptional regulator n=1 Tax=Halopolyspora algeriensis TaxID=1500506 RepID=A0A368VZF5_9ACTN|nr:helix-turn-helix domain-containing protein [Halopolyspora algeriensis]RCW45731.1 AraC family transcriptional regulator [Halopolyspora algeriensis]TQM54115.1 AraC family transcriptional regulator [Halopolyspora algeriensis]
MTLPVDELLTSGLVSRDRGPEVAFDSWKTVVQRSVLRFDFDCDHPRAFRGAVSRRSLAGVDFVSMESEKHGAYRGPETISSSDMGYYVMSLQMSGEFRMLQDGRTAVLRPGLFAIYDSSKPVTLVSSDDYKSVCIKFPKESIGARREDCLAGITATAFDCGVGLSSAVWAMVLSLNRSLGSLGHSGPLAVRNMMELVTAMLRTELGQNELDEAEPREALLRRIREYIDARLSDPDLSPHTVAAAHYISPRYLHSLFAGTDFTVSAWIRARRIELCRRDLADPRMVDVPAVAIAARWGFKGASHFGQVFKRETGSTPAEFRRQAMAQLHESRGCSS